MIQEQEVRDYLQTLLTLRENWRTEFDSVHARPYHYPEGYSAYVSGILSGLREQITLLQWVLGEGERPIR